MISVNGLSVSLGGRRVVDGVSLDIPAGAFAALTGPNGAGKSTLVKAMAGVLAPETGEVCLGGVALSSLSVVERARRAAWLPQARPVAWRSRGGGACLVRLRTSATTVTAIPAARTRGRSEAL